MTTVYRYIFYINKDNIEEEEDITLKIPDRDWEEHLKKWTGRNAVSGKYTHCTCFYARAEVEEDGSFKVV